MEKRNIQISLEEAKEWYNSGDSFKKELALKAYKKEELIDLGFCDILSKIDYCTDERNKIKEKAVMYEKLLIVATYLNSIYEKEYHDGVRLYFYIKPKNQIILTKGFKYKSFTIADTIIKGNYPVYFNSSKAAKKAIDILGEELNVLFE